RAILPQQGGSMKYMLPFYAVLLLGVLSYAQDQSQPLPNSPPNQTSPNFPDSRQPPSQMPPDEAVPAQRTLSTNEAEREIRQHLNSEPALRDGNVNVVANEDSVVLTGTVDSEKQRDIAARVAQF